MTAPLALMLKRPPALPATPLCTVAVMVPPSASLSLPSALPTTAAALSSPAAKLSAPATGAWLAVGAVMFRETMALALCPSTLVTV